MSLGRDGRRGTEPGSALLELVAVMDRLRTECPWDARQTHESLAPYLLEETYEALEAIERHDLAELRGELGDVLLQVLFHSRDRGGADRRDRVHHRRRGEGDRRKLVRRHPHVFADVSVSGRRRGQENWETIKAEERAAAGGGPSSALDGVPMGQPALSLAAQLQRRAQSAGAPPGLADLAVKPGSAVDAGSADESGSVLEPGSADESGSEPVGPIGAELFALVARARAAGVDPELELRRAARVFRERFTGWERACCWRLSRHGVPNDDRFARSVRLRRRSNDAVREFSFVVHRSHPRQADSGLAGQPDRRGRGRARRRHAQQGCGAERRVDGGVRGRRAQGRRPGVRRQGRRACGQRRHRRDPARAARPGRRRAAADRLRDDRPGRHAGQVQAGRQRDTRGQPGGGAGRGRVGPAAAVPLPRRPERARSAGADDEHS